MKNSESGSSFVVVQCLQGGLSLIQAEHPVGSVAPVEQHEAIEAIKAFDRTWNHPTFFLDKNGEWHHVFIDTTDEDEISAAPHELPAEGQVWIITRVQ